MEFVEKVKGLLTSPSDTFDALKEDTLSDVVKYYVVIVAIYSALLATLLLIAFSFVSSILEPLGMLADVGVAGAILFFVMSLITLLLGGFLGGAILHIFVYIVGGREGIAQTIKAVMYGSTPGLLFGWIPLVGLFTGIWSLILEIIGIRQLHGLTTGRAILAFVIPILGMVLVSVIAAFVFTTKPPGF